jgi:electron transfer DM13
MSKKLLLPLGAGIVFVGWYLFRPELLFINKTVNESLPMDTAHAQGGPRELARGTFKGLAHETKGTAAVYELEGGKRMLRLTDFATSNGPAVHVYLVAAKEANDNDSVKRAGFVDLGSLKGNIGNQNYDVPQDTDLGKYQSVSIWCARFGVNFGSSSLEPAPMTN